VLPPVVAANPPAGVVKLVVDPEPAAQPVDEAILPVAEALEKAQDSV